MTVKKKTPSKQQRLILDFIKERGSPDLDEILDLTDAASKASLQFTMRSMIAKGLICKRGTELRRGRMRQTFALAPGGVSFYDPRAEAVSVSHDENLLAISVSGAPKKEANLLAISVSDFSIPRAESLAISVSDFSIPRESSEKSLTNSSEPEVFYED